MLWRKDLALLHAVHSNKIVKVINKAKIVLGTWDTMQALFSPVTCILVYNESLVFQCTLFPSVLWNHGLEEIHEHKHGRACIFFLKISLRGLEAVTQLIVILNLL